MITFPRKFVRVTCLRLVMGMAAMIVAIAPVEAEKIVIRQLPGPNGESIACTVYEPQLPPEGKAGLVVHLYGSGGSHQESEYNIGREPYAECRQLLAERGYWVVVPELGRKHWMNEEACTRVDAVITAMIEEEQVDPERVHLVGMSMGASSSLIYIMRRPDRIKSVVSIFPITDFDQWLEEVPGYRKPVEEAHAITPDLRGDALPKLSPLKNLDAFRKVPVFLLHGDKDNVVPLHHGRDFAEALKKKGFATVFHEVPGATHNDEISRAYQREIADFLTKGIEQ